MENRGKIVRVKVPCMIGCDIIVGDVECNEIGKVDAHWYRDLSEPERHEERRRDEGPDRELIRENDRSERGRRENDLPRRRDWADMFYGDYFYRR